MSESVLVVGQMKVLRKLADVFQSITQPYFIITWRSITTAFEANLRRDSGCDIIIWLEWADCSNRVSWLKLANRSTITLEHYSWLTDQNHMTGKVWHVLLLLQSSQGTQSFCRCGPFPAAYPTMVTTGGHVTSRPAGVLNWTQSSGGSCNKISLNFLVLKTLSTSQMYTHESVPGLGIHMISDKEA